MSSIDLQTPDMHLLFRQVAIFKKKDVKKIIAIMVEIEMSAYALHAGGVLVLEIKKKKNHIMDVKQEPPSVFLNYENCIIYSTF
jgi:hypothetical protein